ncbi:membrane associated rhomboid family serine protease [Catenulispora sp. EB89]|uniref:hypothetical protein n=1 Tax=Catenulispora sp. EB89 TaxID=3156257 RepID=UPI0035131513
MADSAKDRILERIMEEGHTDSYGTLLYLVAVIGVDPMALGPANSVELTTWSGHLDGLKGSLLCLAMYERKSTPQKAAETVDRHLVEAAADLRRGDSAGSAG